MASVPVDSSAKLSRAIGVIDRLESLKLLCSTCGSTAATA